MKELLEKLIQELLADFLGEAFENVSAIDTIMQDFSKVAFHAEEMIGDVLNTELIAVLYKVVMLFGIGLIILKFLKKGFETYTLWTDGDPDADPLTLLTNFFKAIAISMSFLVIYDWIIGATLDLIDRLQESISSKSTDEVLTFLDNIGSGGGKFFDTLFVIVFLIFGIMLYFQFMKRGIEMIVLRLGMPIACMGLLDSDKGVFKPYMQKFFQNSLTVTVQIILGKLGLLVCLNGHFFWAFAIMSVALATPKFLQEFMIGAGGGGGMGNIYQVTNLTRTAIAPLAKMLKK